MQAGQTIQQCIQASQQTSSQLQDMANAETDRAAKIKLLEAAHHLALCVEECNYSLQQLQSGAA